jgi:hypothetical protein
VAQDALVAQVGQRRDRSVIGHALRERQVDLRVVQIHELHPVESESLQALLDRAADPRAGEVAGHRVGVDLGGQDEAGWHAAAAAQHGADAGLRAAGAVVVRGVQEVHRPVEGGLDGGLGLPRIDLVAVQAGHAGQRAGADADRRDRQAGSTEDPGRHVHVDAPFRRGGETQTLSKLPVNVGFVSSGS